MHALYWYGGGSNINTTNATFSIEYQEGGCTIITNAMTPHSLYHMH